jgi:hypothetical protein
MKFEFMAEDQSPEADAPRPLSAAARRALEEAAERRALAEPLEAATEVGGRKGPEPVRYGDWELNGIAQDF